MGNVENKKILEKYIDTTGDINKPRRNTNYPPGYPRIRKDRQKQFKRSYFKSDLDSKVLHLAQYMVNKSLFEKNPLDINWIYSTIPDIITENPDHEGLFLKIQSLLDRNGLNSSYTSKSMDKGAKKQLMARINEFEEFGRTGKRSPDYTYDKPATKHNHPRIPVPKTKDHSPDRSVIVTNNTVKRTEAKATTERHASKTPQRGVKTANISRDNSANKSVNYSKLRPSKSPVKTIYYKPDIVYNTQNYVKSKSNSFIDDQNNTFTKIPKGSDILSVNDVMTKISYLQGSKLSYAELLQRRGNPDMMSHYNTENSTSYNQSSRNSPGDNEQVLTNRLKDLATKDVGNINININEIKIINKDQSSTRNKGDDFGYKYATDYQNYIKNDSIYTSKAGTSVVERIEEKVKEKTRASLERMKVGIAVNNSPLSNSLKKNSEAKETKDVKEKEISKPNTTNSLILKTKEVINSKSSNTTTSTVSKDIAKSETPAGKPGNSNLSKLNKLRNKPNLNVSHKTVKDAPKEFKDTLKHELKRETLTEQKSDSYNSQNDIHTEIKRNTPMFNKPGHGHRRSNSFGGYTGYTDFEPKNFVGAIEEGEKFSFRNKQDEEDLGIRYIPAKVVTYHTSNFNFNF
jgi:hypothetical protein